MRIDDLARRLGRLRRLPAPVVDAAIAVIFVAAVVADRVREPLHGGLTTLLAATSTLVLAGSLAMRRRIPLAAFVTGSVALCAEPLLHVTSVVSPYANQIGLYSVGLYATRARARWGPPIVLVGVLVYFAGTARTTPFVPAGVLFVWLATWALGYSTARRREEQERTRQAIRQQVVAEERTRMARELHDLVGHTLNLLVVRAGAARLMLDKDPAVTCELLMGIEQTGRESLADLDQVLGTLRAQPTSTPTDVRAGSADLHPSPGLARNCQTWCIG